MKLQPRARTGIALIAAYAVALQALLLAVVVPSAGMVTGGLPGLAGAAALPLCASSANHSSPAGHAPDCLDACLTGCCCGAPLVPTPGTAAFFAAAPARIMKPTLAVGKLAAVRVNNAHRSRAPPLA
jgi:hypothetical protein